MSKVLFFDIRKADLKKILLGEITELKTPYFSIRSTGESHTVRVYIDITKEPGEDNLTTHL